MADAHTSAYAIAFAATDGGKCEVKGDFSRMPHAKSNHRRLLNGTPQTMGSGSSAGPRSLHPDSGVSMLGGSRQSLKKAVPIVKSRAKGTGTVKTRPTTTPAKKSSPSPNTRVPKVKSAPLPLVFRNRTPEDDTYILQLTEDQLGTVHQSAFGEPFPREQFLQYIQSGAPTVVFEKNSKRIGYYSYLAGPDGKMHISAMVIEPHFQSKGVGTEVMQRVEEEARQQGIHTLEVFVQTSNEKSLAFTRKLGFVEAFRLDPSTIGFQKRIANPIPQRAASAYYPRTGFMEGQVENFPPVY